MELHQPHWEKSLYQSRKQVIEFYTQARSSNEILLLLTQSFSKEMYLCKLLGAVFINMILKQSFKDWSMINSTRNVSYTILIIILVFRSLKVKFLILWADILETLSSFKNQLTNLRLKGTSAVMWSNIHNWTLCFAEVERIVFCPVKRQLMYLHESIEAGLITDYWRQYSPKVFPIKLETSEGNFFFRFCDQISL